MTLADLRNLVENANTMGFKPEEVEIHFKYYFSELDLKEMKSEVKAGETVKPLIKIELR